MREEEEKIMEEATKFAKINKRIIARELTDLEQYPSRKDPVSVFMAGSPGSGKTESAKWLIKKLSNEGEGIIRIDPDELRTRFGSYNGSNSYLFQYPTSILVEKIHDFVIKNDQDFVIDTTFSKPEVGRKNIQRSINRKRLVQILYVYQDPLIAWKFVKKREQEEGRNIPKDAFIKEYFAARENVEIMKKEFPEIKVSLIVKNLDGSTELFIESLGSSKIDNYIDEDIYSGNIKKYAKIVLCLI